MSRTWGMFSRITSSSVRMAAAMQGNAEFFAPDTRMVPSSGFPPRMTNLSIRSHELLRFQFRTWRSIGQLLGRYIEGKYGDRRADVRARSRSRHCYGERYFDGWQYRSEVILEFQHRIIDRQPYIAVGLGKATNGFRLVDAGFEHHQGHRHTATCALDGVHSGLAVDFAGAHEDADAAFDELGVLHMHVDHQVLVHIAQTGHGAGGDHVEHHLLRAAGLHAGGTGNHLGAHLGDDGDVGSRGQWRIMITSDRRGVRAASPGVSHGGNDVRRTPGSGEADHYVLAGGASAGNVALAELL